MIRASWSLAIVVSHPDRSIVVVPSPWATLGGLSLTVTAAGLGIGLAGLPWLTLIVAILAGPFLLTRFLITTRSERIRYTALCLLRVSRRSRSRAAIYFDRVDTADDWTGEPGPIVRFFLGAVEVNSLPEIPCFRPNALARLLNEQPALICGLPGIEVRPRSEPPPPAA